MIDPISSPTQLPLIAPSLLAADFGNLADEARASLNAGADLLHVDVMDNHFVPNLSMGPAICESLRTSLPDAYLDVHLMVTDPESLFEPFVRSGANLISFHIEVCDDEAHARRLCDRLGELGVHTGIVINPPTDVERVLPVVDAFDLVLVMSVNPGFGGQSFIPEVLDKCRAIRARLRENQRLEIDGGINPETAARAIDAGCDLLVAGSSIFSTPRETWSERIADLRS